MNHDKNSHLCEEAELYYINLAFGDESGEIPERIAAHVESCSYCRERLNDLKDNVLVTNRASTQDSKTWKSQTHMLGLHFAHLGRGVGCGVVKPFLPTLTEPSLEVRIPTPITVHLDRCEPCNFDLNTIRDMDLTSKHLGVLNSIFTDKSSMQKVDCSIAAAFIRQYVNFEFQAIRPELIKHLCCCSVCQLLIYKARANKIEDLHGQNLETTFPCESVTFSDVFDYCFPYGLEPCSDQYAGFRESFVKELRQCPACLQKVQQMHQQVYAIKERPESGIITIYEISEEQKSGTTSKAKSNYEDFPISVKTVASEGQWKLPRTQQDRVARLGDKTHALPVRLKNVVRAVAAAAVIAVVSMLLYSLPSASAVTIQQIYNAIQNAANVHIKQYAAEGMELLQEKLVSKDLGLYAVKDEYNLVVWDVTNKLKHTSTVGVSGQKTIDLTELQIATMKKRIHSSLDLMPFSHISEVPENAEWQELDASATEGPFGNTRVCELTWTVPTSEGVDLPYKWRAFVQKETQRPLRIEFYGYDIDSGTYELQVVRTVVYLTDDQAQKLIADFNR